MKCDRCNHEALLFQKYSGRYLCQYHLISDIEVRAKKALRSQGGVGRGGIIGILWQGIHTGALMLFLSRLCSSRNDLSVSLFIPTSKGNLEIVPFRNESMLDDISLAQKTWEKYLEQNHILDLQKTNENLISKIFDESELRLLFLPEYLEEYAGWVFQNLLDGDVHALISERYHSNALLRIPFLEIPFEEMALYLRSVKSDDLAIMNHVSAGSSLLDTIAKNHPSVHFSILSYHRRMISIASSCRDI